jgi:hypothetical protein
MTVYHTVEDGNGKVLEQTELPDPEPTVGEARALHRHAGAAHLVDGAEDRGEHLGRGAGLMRRTVARVLAALAVLVAVSCEGVRPAGNDPLPRRPGAFTELIGPAVARPLISDVGAFRVNCGLSHLNYSDPIVAPGKPLGSHLHQFFGNTATDWRSTAASIASTGGSTCTGGTLNRTAYWTPALIDTRGHDCTGTEAEVIAEGCRALIPGGDPAKARSCDPFAWVEFCTDSVNAMQVYYKTGYDGVAPASVQPFPPGLRMIAGNARATSAQPLDVAWWTCKQNHGDQGPRSATIAGTGCRPGQLLTAAVEFPQCWDGRNLDSPDHKSHMAYGAGWPDKGCPSSHPVPLAQVTTWVHWRLPAGVNLANLRLASDMHDGPGGIANHSDWFGGWDRDTFDLVVERVPQPVA